MRVEGVRSEKDPAQQSEPEIGSLGACLVDGNLAEVAGVKRGRRRAMAVSLLLQIAAVAAIIVVPLLWATERIAMGAQPPGPIFVFGNRTLTTQASQPQHSSGTHAPCVTCFWHVVPTGIHPDNKTSITSITDNVDTDPGEIGKGVPEGIGDGDPSIDPNSRLMPVPRPPEPRHQGPVRISVTTIEPAMLLYRVEPVFPQIALQTHHSGRVKLHAIIGTDGSIRELQAANGDPMFLRSALDAVTQWRYRPTNLNGQPVEVETIITVIYNIQ